MKTLTVIVASMLAYASFAEMRLLTDEEKQLLSTPYQKLTPEQKQRRPALIRLQELIEEGGAMDFPGTPRGTIRIVSTQKRVAVSDFERVLKMFGSNLAYDIAIVEADCDATLKINIVDDPKAPVLLVAPEDRWAQINVAKLAADNPKPTFLAARTRKMIFRAFSFLTAGTASDMPLFGSLRSIKELDRIVESGFNIDVIMRTRKYLEHLDVMPREPSSYYNVLSAGYDIAPTNDYQKAIYEKVSKEVPLTKKLK